MKITVRTLEDLGEDIILAPERHVAVEQAHDRDGAPLGELVVERRERLDPDSLHGALVLDTTHAKDGVLDLAAAERDAARSEPAKSAKKVARAGDLLVSRLRPYLRQIALVRSTAIGERPLAVSPEFFVLASRGEEDLAFLLPFLLGEHAQSVLAAAQEGGHHPRVPASALFALRVPHRLVRTRREKALEVGGALDRLYEASSAFRACLLSRRGGPHLRS